MDFATLCNINKDWEESTELIISSWEDKEVVQMRKKAASHIFGKNQVLWFRDCVVMLL